MRGLLTTTRRSERVLYIDEFSDLSIGRTFSTSTRAPDSCDENDKRIRVEVVARDWLILASCRQ
jgi:hypothetical protein